jgi:CelD/BcsL family acetyltransferase involved in cellulose biosynthesis
MEVCPVITLPESFEAHLAQMDKKQRHELRRKLRRAETATMDWYIVDDSHELTAETELFLQLMASANPDKAKFLQNPAHVAFFQRIVPMFYTLGWLQLAILRVEDVPAAAYLNFVYNHEVGVYNSGLNLEVGAAFSPGIVLLAYLIESAIQRGYRRFDFLRGDEEYKYRIGGRDEILYRMVAHATPTT